MLDEILSEYKPRNWVNINYSNRRYVLVQLTSNGSTEYNEVTTPFRRYRIGSVERVQHPYALGYFMLKKKQLMNRGESRYEVPRYHPVSFVDKAAALEYNLDVRKYNSVRNLEGNDFSEIFLDEFQSKPQLYRDTQIDRLVARYDTFIVCKALVDESNRYTTVIEPSYESEYMPEYVVKILKN